MTSSDEIYKCILYDAVKSNNVETERNARNIPSDKNSMTFFPSSLQFRIAF